MKKIIIGVLFVFLSCIAEALTEARYLDLQKTATPRLDALQASAKTFRWTITDNGSNWNGTGSFPWMYIGPNPTNSGIVTAACSWVSMTGGVFEAAFSSQDLNTNGLGWIYGIGVTSNAVNVFRQGAFLLRPDPYAVGAGPVNFATNLNASLYTWVGAINGYAVADVLISTTGNTAVANQALVTSTNAVAIANQATNTAQTVSTNLTAQISIVTNDLNSVSNSLYSQLIATNVASTNFAAYLFTIAHTDLVQNTAATLQLIDTVSQSIPPITTAVDRTTNVVSVLTNLIVSGTISPDSTGVYTQAAPLVVATRQWNLSTNSYLQYFTNGAPICMLTNILGGRWDCSTNTTGAPEGLYDPSGGASGTSQVFVTIETNITYTTNSVIIDTNNIPPSLAQTNDARLVSMSNTNNHISVRTPVADSDAANAGWVRGLFDVSSEFFVTTNRAYVGWDTNNVFQFQNDTAPAVQASRTYTGLSNGMYLGCGITTSKVSSVQGPIVVNSYLSMLGGSANRSLTVRPEIYYTYSTNATTRTLGDWEGTAQEITTGTNLYSWVISFPKPTLTGDVYVVRCFRVVDVQGTPNKPDFGITLGSNTSTHIGLNVPGVSSGIPDAPADSNVYSRINNTWTNVPIVTGSTNGINNWWMRTTNTWDLSTAAGYRLGQLTNDNAVHTINLDSHPDFVPSNARAIVVYYDVAVSSLGGTFYLWPGTTYNGNSITIKPKTTGFDDYDSRLLIIGTNRILSYQSGSGADITYVYLALGTGL